MPPLLVAVGLLALGWYLIRPKPGVATGYLNGKPFCLTLASIGNGDVLEASAAAGWLALQAAAAADGVTLQPKGPNSAFRTEAQQALMEVERPSFAAALGHSPHQQGIAVDVDLTSAGDPLAWLQENGATYDWYPLTGAAAAKEPWHWEFHGGAQEVS